MSKTFKISNRVTMTEITLQPSVLPTTAYDIVQHLHRRPLWAQSLLCALNPLCTIWSQVWHLSKSHFACPTFDLKRMRVGLGGSIMVRITHQREWETAAALCFWNLASYPPTFRTKCAQQSEKGNKWSAFFINNVLLMHTSVPSRCNDLPGKNQEQRSEKIVNYFS